MTCPYALCNGSGLAHDRRFCWCIKGRFLAQGYAQASRNDAAWNRFKAEGRAPAIRKNAEPTPLGELLKGWMKP